MDTSKICRCCLAKGATRDLSTSYSLFEKKEVYSEMLQECFNIVLVPSANNNGICEACVKNLRESFCFKQQVIRAEDAFLNSLTYEELDTKPLVKTEPEQSDCDSDNFVDTIKEESPSRADTDIIAKIERPRRKTRSRSQKTEQNHKKIANFVTKLNINSGKLQMKTSKQQKSSTKKKKEKQNSIDLTWTKKSVADKRKHRDNLLTILKYSNVIPFKHKNLLGFVCGYCDATYPDPLDLRSHTEKDHEQERFDFKSSFDMAEYSVKLDITDLICKICTTKMDNLTKLKDHLVKNHNKIVYNDIKDHIMQFKLKKGDVFDCVMCPSTYETFKMLKQHMNKHYGNYSCTKCENSFATKRSLNAHQGTHQDGSFKCDLCEKVFSSRTKKQYHEKTKHLGTRNISNCLLCDVPFRSYYQRNQHMVKVHNSEAQYKCNVCSKGYVLKSLLMCHIKKNHLMERNCQCTECGYRFFSNKALKAHMVKHTGERKYACEVCHKSYARKYTLREHMRIHNNDRRFKCEVCATSFVQKCSLKSHLLSHHGISLAASDISSRS
ncbi:oocyte zinc finger protein XlCOF6-like [Maniola hyperantus]|uniref:oocyte zinc finger protein XlCOF6-like n=1 Tax=Aphantopus hyperantus TaxID=2795564 RepID=UPI001567DC0B|nr:zinc finger protein 836-like [Maniola hyperantus]